MDPDRSWRIQSENVCRVLIDLFPKDYIDKNVVNASLTSLLELTKHPDCPMSYKIQASKIQLDGEWGDVAQATLLLLAKLADRLGTRGVLYVDVNTYINLYEFLANRHLPP